MPMTKTELKKAFREAASYEFRGIPHDEAQIYHEFSPAFERKITKLIQKEQKVLWHFVNTASKRVAIIAAVFFMLCTMAFSVKAIREPIVRFLIEIYETFTEYHFEGDTAEIITKEYKMTSVPEGFTQTDLCKEDGIIAVTYKNTNGDTISFTQSITADTSITIDNEHSETEIIHLADREIHFYSQDGINAAVWVEDAYLFELFCSGNVDRQTIIDIIAAIE